MNLPARLSSTLLLVACAGGIAAADSGWLGLTDLRVFYDRLDESSDIDTNISDTFDSEFDDAWRIGVGAQGARRADRSPIGFSHGGSLSYLRWDDDTLVDQRYEALAVQIRLGLGIYAGDWFHIEVTPLAGIGGARAEVGGDESEIGLYWEYGAEAGAYATFGIFQIGVHAGYLWNGFDLEFEEGLLDGLEADVETDGAYVGASIGLRF